VRIAVDELSNKGRTVPFSLEDVWARAAVAEALDGSLQALKGEVRIQRASPGVKAVVDASAVADRTCDRCGVGVALAIHAEEELLFLPAGMEVDDDETELEADELDVGWYHDDSLNLADVLSEAFALNLPMRITCTVAATEGNEAEAEAACTARMSPAAAGDDRIGNPFAVLSKLR
jgi:uncharacterized metal-binding protein YceD (DUF177 family)